MKNYCIKYVSLSGRNLEAVVSAKTEEMAVISFHYQYNCLDVISVTLINNQPC